MGCVCRKLRNADAALQLLSSFEGTQDTGPLAAQLLAKTTDILAQYARELDAASTQFRAGKVHTCYMTRQSWGVWGERVL